MRFAPALGNTIPGLVDSSGKLLRKRNLLIDIGRCFVLNGCGLENARADTMIQRRSFIGGLVASVGALICGRKVAAVDADLRARILEVAANPADGDHSFDHKAKRIGPGLLVRTRFVNDYFINGDRRIPEHTLMRATHNPRVVMDGQFYVDHTQLCCTWDMKIDGQIQVCRRMFAVYQLEVVE